MRMRRRDFSRLWERLGRRDQRGLTAIELMVTLAILAILLGIAAPSMTRFIAQWRVSNALNALTGALRIARTEAIARARPIVVCQVASVTATACLTGTAGNGFASGWIVFVNQDRDTASAYSLSAGDELLLRQDALPGIEDITPTRSGRLTFLPNGLMSAGAIGFNVDAKGYDKLSTTPWARKAICISKPGRVRYVADTVDCSES